MNLIKFPYRYDFGHDWCVQILAIKKRSLLQVAISWSEIPSPPFLQIKFDERNPIDVQSIIYKLGFDMTVCGRTWLRRYHKDE